MGNDGRTPWVSNICTWRFPALSKFRAAQSSTSIGLGPSSACHLPSSLPAHGIVSNAGIILQEERIDKRKM